MSNVESFYKFSASLEKLIHQIAKESNNAKIPHRKSGHIIGEIGISLIFSCLENGKITNHPEPDEFKNPVCEMSYFTAGIEICISLAVDTQNKIIHILHVES